MSGKQKGVAVMLDADIAEALRQAQSIVVQKMNSGGVYGMAAKPTLGYLARQLLRERLGLSNSNDKHTEN